MSRKSQKILVKMFFTRSKQTDEKIARDMLRLELMAMLRLAAQGHGTFAQDLLARAPVYQRDVMKKEMRDLAAMLEVKIDSEDEA